MKYKWVQTSPGKYRLVDETDPRPAAKLKGSKGTPKLRFTPSWKKHEAEMNHPSDQKQMEATDKFIAEREHAMKTDPKAKRWEEGRKKEWARNKPAWRKQIMKRGDR